MRTCRLCPAYIGDKYIVCWNCLPKYQAWKRGKQALRSASLKAAGARVALRADRPWGGIFDRP